MELNQDILVLILCGILVNAQIYYSLGGGNLSWLNNNRSFLNHNTNEFHKYLTRSIPKVPKLNDNVFFKNLFSRINTNQTNIEETSPSYEESSTMYFHPAPEHVVPRFSPQLHRNFKLLPSDKGECGIQGFVDKIIGGEETEIDEFPWMALLKYRKNGKTIGFLCGGVLISNLYVLTAAHCIKPDLHSVRLGEHDLNTIKDCSGQICNDKFQKIKIEQVIVHPGYQNSNKNYDNDIALIRLRNPATIKDYVRPICLPINNDKTPLGSDLTIAGWGITETGYESQVLKKASLPVIDQEKCKKSWEKLINLSENQFCAGGSKHEYACHGDSGGPIMNTFKSSNIWYIEGIISVGITNCEKREMYPNVFVRVSNYLEWILDNIRD